MRSGTCHRHLAVVLAVFLLQNSPVGAQEAPVKLNIVIVEGEGAINNVRQRVAREPIIQVEDENRKPIAGAAVTFLLPNQGAGATFANGARTLTITTDSKGQAVARSLRPNNVNGQYQIRVNASFQGQTASTTISQTNAVVAAVAGAAGVGISAKLLALIIAAGAAVAAGTVVAVTGGGSSNSSTPGAGGTPRPGVVITPGTPTVGGPQ